MCLINYLENIYIYIYITFFFNINKIRMKILTSFITKNLINQGVH